MMTNIVIATTKSWNLERAKVFAAKNKNKYKITIIDTPKKLKSQSLKRLKPIYIFFPHWSWIIPQDIFDNFTCVVFHMTDLPFGRGGSPLQNLLVRGVYKTKISALKVDGGLDTGPIYLKENVNIKEGNAEDILKNISNIVFSKMIPRILSSDTQPKKQKGEVVAFKRRKPEQSEVLRAELKSLRSFYDFIRMLDGEGYPSAFVDLGNGCKLMLKNASLGKSQVGGNFVITKEKV